MASAPFVLALQNMGAILIGKAAMHEIGLGVTGLNLRTGTALNPSDPTRYTGGSSSGSAALIAAGVCPIAIGQAHALESRGGTLVTAGNNQSLKGPDRPFLISHSSPSDCAEFLHRN